MNAGDESGEASLNMRTDGPVGPPRDASNFPMPLNVFGYSTIVIPVNLLLLPVFRVPNSKLPLVE